MALGVALHSIAADKAVTNPDTEKPAHEKRLGTKKRATEKKKDHHERGQDQEA